MRDGEQKIKQVKNSKSLNTQLQKSAHQAYGAGSTRDQRMGKLELFNNYLKRNNIQISSIEQIKAKYIEGYIQERIAQGKNLRTLHNDMSAIRKTLKAAGRTKLAYSERISNKALGISGASRKGTKTAITEQQYQTVLQTATAKNKHDIAALIQLARCLGLRGEEAVQSIQSLKTWQTAINQGKDTLHIVFGTKGGRPRETKIINRKQVTQAINNAIEIANQQNGKLINKPNLKQAMTYWRNQTTALGLTGKIAPHSLRYAFAQDLIKHYQAQGYTEQEALALTSMDLGHGDGRGRYVKEAYGIKS